MPNEEAKPTPAQLAFRRFQPKLSGLSQLTEPWVTSGVSLASRFVMQSMNRLEVEGLEKLEMLRQTRGAGLLTFSNHVSILDDPLLLSCFGLRARAELRWIAADALNFFGGPVRAWFSNAGKCVPIIRGAGVDQLGLDFLVSRLKARDWVHVFPEGGRTRSPQALLKETFKSGVNRLVLEARPKLLGFYHYGMHELLPIGARIPRRGCRVHLRFGDAADAAIAGGDPARWMQAQLRTLELKLNPHAMK